MVAWKHQYLDQGADVGLLNRGNGFWLVRLQNGSDAQIPVGELVNSDLFVKIDKQIPLLVSSLERLAKISSIKL
jgi:hypothetical protein